MSLCPVLMMPAGAQWASRLFVMWVCLSAPDIRSAFNRSQRTRLLLLLRLVVTGRCCAGAHCIKCGKEHSLQYVKEAVFSDSICHCSKCG